MDCFILVAQFFSFSSNRCIIFKTNQCKRVYPMEFIFLKLKAYIVQTATLLHADFVTYTFGACS